MEPIRMTAFCPHCCNRAPQTLVHSQPCEFTLYDVKDGSPEIELMDMYVASCDTCKGLLIYSDMGGGEDKEHFADNYLVWPEKKTLHQAVPKDIRQVYEEAMHIRMASPDAFAVQIRRGLEAICVDRGVNEKNLSKALRMLADKGEIPPVLARITDVLRLLGNVGAHWTGQHVHPLQTNALDDFFRAIVEYIYVAPSKLKDFQDGLEQFKKISTK